MIQTIKFNELSAMLLDFVDGSDGFLYLRMVGASDLLGGYLARDGLTDQHPDLSSRRTLPY